MGNRKLGVMKSGTESQQSHLDRARRNCSLRIQNEIVIPHGIYTVIINFQTGPAVPVHLQKSV